MKNDVNRPTTQVTGFGFDLAQDRIEREQDRIEFDLVQDRTGVPRRDARDHFLMDV